MRDFEASLLHGRPMDKPCARCGGTGHPDPADHRPLCEVLSRGKWEKGWYPLYQAVLAWCHVQACYRRMTAA